MPIGGASAGPVRRDWHNEYYIESLREGCLVPPGFSVLTNVPGNFILSVEYKIFCQY